MAETYPYLYEHPYAGCQTCGGSCFGKSCLRPGCEYIERASHNRFEKPPVPTESNYSCKRYPKTCKTVNNMIMGQGEFLAPLSLPISSQCTTRTAGDAFKASHIKYQHL